MAFVYENRVVTQISVQGQEGAITLPYTSKNQILENIQRRVSIQYKVNFPNWHEFPPKVTKILFNGEVICVGESYSCKY